MSEGQSLGPVQNRRWSTVTSSRGWFAASVGPFRPRPRDCPSDVSETAALPQRRARVVADVADVPVERLAVRAEAGLDAHAVEIVDLLARPREEAEVEVLRRRRPVGDVEVREARPVRALRELPDPERPEHRLVE